MRVRCERCEGKGWHPDYSSTMATPKKCFACGGEGIVEVSPRAMRTQQDEDNALLVRALVDGGFGLTAPLGVDERLFFFPNGETFQLTWNGKSLGFSDEFRAALRRALGEE